MSGRQDQLLEHKIFVYIDFESVFCVFPSAFNFEMTSWITVFTDPRTVEDLIEEDDITDQVPVQRLQLLGSHLSSPFLHLPWRKTIKCCKVVSFFLITGKSKELRDLLCNPHLRCLLESIDSADSKYDAIKVAMQEPLFTEFSDECLKIVEKGNGVND